MRVVIDANIAIAAAASRGLCEAVMELCLERHEIIFSEAILQDIREKLIKKIKVPAPTADAYLIMLRCHSELHEPETVDADVCRDPDDNTVLGLVSPSGATVIISGDQDLLVIGQYKGAKILSPRQFWEQNKI
jgi:putative PIN family toxin of toxin-antitoxin system